MNQAVRLAHRRDVDRLAAGGYKYLGVLGRQDGKCVVYLSSAPFVARAQQCGIRRDTGLGTCEIRLHLLHLPPAAAFG